MYLLRNKDKNLLSFEMIKKENKIQNSEIKTTEVVETYQVCIDKIYEDVTQWPFPLQTEGGHCDGLNRRLEIWLKSRKIPKNRAFVENLMQAIDAGANPFKYIDVTYGLSLTDTFWICPKKEENLSWADVNLYQNPFDEQVARLAFTGMGRRIHGLTTTPEFTTNGALRKCWHRENHHIYLLKGGSECFANGGLEPYIETWVTEIAKIMDLNYVPYELTEFHGILVSRCPIFTDENTGFIPIYYVLGADYFLTHSVEDPETWKEIAHRYGIEAWEDMLLFDAVIANEDRHLGNFGLLVDNNSNQLKGPAPLFDHGNALFFSATKEDFTHVFEYAKTRRSFMGLPFAEQGRLFLRRRHVPGLEKLSQLALPRYKDSRVDYVAEKVERYVHHIAKELVLLYKEHQCDSETDVQINKSVGKGSER